MLVFIPFKAFLVDLEFQQDTKTPFFHEYSLGGFLRNLAEPNSAFTHEIRFECLDSGREYYPKRGRYRFLILSLGNDHSAITTIYKNLKNLGNSDCLIKKLNEKKDRQSAFNENLRLISIYDALTANPINSIEQATSYSLEQHENTLRKLTQELAISQSLNIVIDSRFRIIKQDPKQDNNSKNRGTLLRDERSFDANLFIQRSILRCQQVSKTLDIAQSNQQHSPNDSFTINESCLFYLHDQLHANSKDFSGMAGRFSISNAQLLNSTTLSAIVMAQYIGIGMSTAFGLGRFQISSHSLSSPVNNEQTNSPYLCVNKQTIGLSILHLAAEEKNLRAAWAHVIKNSDSHLANLYKSGQINHDQTSSEPSVSSAPSTPAADNWQAIGATEQALNEQLTDKDDSFGAPIEKMSADIDRILTGEYQAPNLTGVLIPKTSGGWRALAIPPLYDRALQRAISQIITPQIDKLLHEKSFGYRTGRSRQQAGKAIQAAWQAGYQWVFESDIDDFFNCVNWQSLHTRLRALFKADPAVEGILQWMQANIVYEHQTIERQRGLPQGAPLSPLMANLLLDDFDTDMESAGFKMVRFADDFVVMCKNRDQAERAQKEAETSLASHGLTLKPEKTAIVSMDRGFHYLGYLFVNDLVLDVSSGKSLNTAASGQTTHANQHLQQHPWMQALIEQSPEHLDSETQLNAWLKRLMDKVGNKQVIAMGSLGEQGKSLFITGSHSVLTSRGKHLKVTRNDKTIVDEPWSHIGQIFLFGNHQITNQAMQAALSKRICVYIANGVGVYKGSINSEQPSHHESPELWLKQIATQQAPEQCLYIARELITARIKHQRETLRQRGREAKLEDLLHQINKANKAKTLDELRGHEGYSSRLYFGEIAELFAEEWHFDGRNRQPPRDPFNVLLSIGYTVIYGYTNTIIHSQGLYPWAGFLHKPHGRHAALASDLMEPFRHVAERAAITVIQRQQISIDDFSYTPAGRCNISNSARRAFLALFHRRWQHTIKAKGMAETQNHFQHLEAQTRSLKEFIRSGKQFTATQFR